MPTVIPTPVKAYAHCTNAMCAGYHQEEVDAIREETSWTIGENGGDGAFMGLIERSVIDYRFVNQEDAPCPVCTQPRIVTGEPRPSYQRTQYDPMYLVNSQAAQQMGVPAPDPRDLKIADLESKLDTLLAALEGSDK